MIYNVSRGKKQDRHGVHDAVEQKERFAVKSRTACVYRTLLFCGAFTSCATCMASLGHALALGVDAKKKISRAASVRTAEHGTVGFRYGSRRSTYNTLVLLCVRKTYR